MLGILYSVLMNGMVRPPNDGVHLETPQAQIGSSSVGVPAATSGNTSSATPSTEISIPDPTSIDVTKEAELASEQPISAARSAGATTSGSKAVNEDSEDMPILTDGRFSIRAEAAVETEDLRELTGNRHRQDRRTRCRRRRRPACRRRRFAVGLRTFPAGNSRSSSTRCTPSSPRACRWRGVCPRL